MNTLQKATIVFAFLSFALLTSCSNTIKGMGKDFDQNFNGGSSTHHTSVSTTTTTTSTSVPPPPAAAVTPPPQ